MLYVGIDYSLSCPAMVVYCDCSEGGYCIEGDQAYHFYYMHGVKSRIYNTDHLHSFMVPEHKAVSQDIADKSVHSSMTRFRLISHWFIHQIRQFPVKPERVFLEGYSLGSKGKVFSIAEHTAVLKMGLMYSGYPTTIIPPTVVKKHAVGKGNAKKDMLVDAFLETGPKDILEPVSHYKDSPLTDLVDAYWILHTGIHLTKTQ